MNSIKFIAFDLDGTLLDTAKDFFLAVNHLRSKYQLKPCEFGEIRSRVSEGAISLAQYALDLDDNKKEDIELHRQELLKIYDSCCLNETSVFEGISELLIQINKANLKWGIITNKPKYFADKIVNHFFSSFEPSCLICPEHTGERKPSPKGLLKACELVGTEPSSSIYIGDHSIDIEAGKRANIKTIAAAYGYIPKGQTCSEWKADFIAESPFHIKNFIPSLND
tara:strand:+ start:84 stop:755 length:672 start_codon:yes stop_codon:yes gene_type:complete